MTLKHKEASRLFRLWQIVPMLLFALVFMDANSELSFAVTHIPGEKFGGGIVFYVDKTREHGLIAAKEDICRPYTDKWGGTFGAKGVDFRWSTGEYKNAKAADYAYVGLGTGTATGMGRTNTLKILKKYPASKYPNSAAAVASRYRGGGFRDWFLPSKDELNELYRQMAVVGGFAGYDYWSSSEHGGDQAWGEHFYNGGQDADHKSLLNRVRAVRAF